MDLTSYIRDIPDFPKPGILFKDITPLLADPAAFEYAIARLAAHYSKTPIDAIAAAEARGFLFAAPLALELHKPLVPLRKPGKLPYRTYSLKYDLEYGEAELHMHVDGDRRRGEGAAGRRPAGDRRHDGGRLQADRAGRRHGRRLRLPGRVGVPERPREADRVRRVQPDHLLTEHLGGEPWRATAKTGGAADEGRDRWDDDPGRRGDGSPEGVIRRAKEKVAGPAIGLIITGILSLLGVVIGLVQVFVIGLGAQFDAQAQADRRGPEHAGRPEGAR